MQFFLSSLLASGHNSNDARSGMEVCAAPLAAMEQQSHIGYASSQMSLVDCIAMIAKARDSFRFREQHGMLTVSACLYYYIIV